MTAFDATLTAEVADLLNREVYLLDRRQWDDWIALYAEDAVYWAPAFASDDEMTDDPDNDVSLLYMDRNGLEARIFRIESGDSYASDPLPWTAHLVTNILVTDIRGDEIDVSASWLVHSFNRVYGSIQRGGLYDYTLRREAAGLRIARKKIMVFDDCIIGPLDIYNI
ncbi:MAG: aromatic-ring-hydroxylating dioxygenase subunit beta [Rhodospirillales bacterium]|nr:aromatic-ring-hydroxylating dioxygenase subunit beta [Rhodospirillales bacterium]